MIKLYFDEQEIEKDYYRSLSQSYILFDKSFCLGSAPSNAFKIELNNKANISSFNQAKIELDEKDYAHVFYDNLDNSNDNKSIISLSDAMVDFEFNYDASPLIKASEKGYVTLLEILEDICNKIGVTLATKDFNLNDMHVTWYDNEITARQYISFIATLNGGFAKINRNGELELVRYTNEIKAEINSNTCLGYKIGEYHKITRVVWDIGVDIWEFGDETGNTLYLDTENPFITKKEDVESIYNLINGFEFYSMEISKCPIDSNIEIGDTIAFRNGDKVYPFIAQLEYSYNAAFRGGYKFIVDTAKIEETKASGLEKKVKSIKSRLNRDEAELEIIAQETLESKQKINNLSTPILTKQGNNHICIEDALESNAIEYNIEGKCKQDGEPSPSNPIEIKTIKGIKDIDESHKGYWIKSKVMGKNLVNIERFNVGGAANKFSKAMDNINANKEYTLFFIKSRIDGETIVNNQINQLDFIEFYNNDDLLSKVNQPLPTVNIPSGNHKTTYTFTTPQNCNKLIVGFSNINGDTNINTLVSQIQLEERLEATRYETYKENNILVNFNKPNLFDKNNANILNAYLAGATSSIIEQQKSKTLYISCNSNTTYTIKKISSENFNIATTIEEPTYGTIYEDRWIRPNKDVTEHSYTTNANAKYLLLQYSDSSNTIDEQEILDSIEIYEGYEPYYELCSIDGVRDNLKVTSGTLTNRIGKIVLDGSNYNYGKIDGNSNENFIQINVTIPDFDKIDSSELGSKVFCSHFPYYSSATSKDKNQPGIRLWLNNMIIFSVPTEIASTKDGFVQWLKANPVTIYYIMTESEEIQITPTNVPLFEGENHIQLEEDIETNTSIRYYRQNSLNEAYYTKSENDAQFKITSDQINSTVSSTRTELKNNLNDLNNNLNNNFYQKTQVEQLILDSSNGLTNTFSEAGGNNILRNTNFSAKEVLEEGQIYEYWYGNAIRNVNSYSANGYSIILQNNSFYQEQTLANGNYTLSFFYKKTNPLAKIYVKVNDNQYELDSTDFSLFQTGIKDENESYIIEPIVITDNHVKVEFICDTNNACEVYDIMLNAGKVKLAYSQNQNETITDTVNIGRGISIKSSASDTEFVANNEAIGFKNNSGKFTTEFNSKGMSTNEAVIKDEAEIVGILRQKVGDQIWDCMI